jgi:hypothetical protein
MGASALSDVSRLKFDYTSENLPNPEVFLPSLRMAGYTLETSVGDLVDNPLDKEATVVAIRIGKDDDSMWTIEVADDGVGMDLQTLDQMMRLGSRVDHNLDSGLGRFGLGSTTASLALGRMQHVITRPEPSTYFSAAADLDKIVKERAFVKHLAEAQSFERDIFASVFEDARLPVPETGTVVRILRGDNVGRNYGKPAVDSVKRYVGEVYRYFIDAGRKFYVNGDLVEAIDPLDRRNPETTTLLDDVFEFKSQGSDEPERVGVILVQLPDWGGQEANRAHGITLERSGLYVMRNRRQVAAALTFNIFSRHNVLSRFRGELLFPASLDVDLGITFMKSSWNLRPSQGLHDKLAQVIAPYHRQARKLYLQSRPTATETIPHEEAAKVIAQRSPFLRRPKSKIEKRATPEASDDSKRERQQGDRVRQPKEPRTQNALGDAARFEVRDLGATAPMYEADLVGRKIVITYNVAHPFYERFILENRDNRGIISGIDYLVYSLASAELLARDEDTYRFIERMREDMSFNLRQLLTT